jgi:predicted Zn-dependent peptidase
MEKIVDEKLIKINNLQCVLINYPCSPVISAGFFVKIGSAYESNEERGISHFLEHMLFKKKTNQLDQLGISYNAATSREYTYYECHGNNKQITDLVDLLFLIFTQPVFVDKEIDSEREVIFEEMKGDKMSTKKQLYESTMLKVFGNKNEKYSLPIIGNDETLRSINSTSLKTYFDKYYHYDNSTFVIIGKMDFLSVTNHIKKLVKKYPRSGYKTKDIEFADVKIAPTMSLKPSSNLSQTTMMVNFYVKGLTELQKLQLGLLHHILTGNFMSILFNELRVKRGLCYSVESDNILIKTTSAISTNSAPSAISTRYNGIIFIKIDADPTKIKECLKLILQFILTRKIKNSQFLNSKKSLDNTISFSFQTSKDYLYYYGNMFLNNETTEPSKLTKILKNTTLSNINNLLDIIKKGDLYVNMIGEFIK